MTNHIRARAAKVAARPSKKPQVQREWNRCQEANIRTRQIGKRGDINRSILLDTTARGIRRQYHATKGWRFERVALG